MAENARIGSYNPLQVTAVTSRPLTTPAARAWFVDGTNGADSNAGDQNAPFLTIGAAISAATSGRGDTVVIAPGTYTITAALVPKANMTFTAGRITGSRKPNVIITGDIADMIQIDVDDTAWYGIEFKAGGNTTDNLIDIADTAAVDGVIFDNCVFHGDDKTSVIGIRAVDATFALTRMTVRNCLFRDLTGTMISIGALGFAYSYIAYNQFAHDINSGIAIALADTTAFATGKGWIIEHNDFTAFDATGDEVGISIAGTEDTTGAGMIRNNYFSYSAAATAVTIDKLGKATINNYVAAATGGGTIVTTGS